MAVVDADGIAWVSTPKGIVQAKSPEGRAVMFGRTQEAFAKHTTAPKAPSRDEIGNPNQGLKPRGHGR
jgi:hypothetical protein